MVDYSKFDKLAREVDEEEAKAPQRSRGLPGVTKLDGKTTITVGKDGQLSFATAGGGGGVPTTKATAKAGVDYSKWDKIEVSDDEEDGDFEEEGTPMEEVGAPGMAVAPELPAGVKTTTSSGAEIYVPSSSKTPVAATAMPRDTVSPMEHWTRNGGTAGPQMFWSQTKDDVTVCFVAPPKTRAKEVKVRLTSKTLACTVKKEPVPAKAVGAGAELAFPAAVEDDDDGTDLDWEVMDHPMAPDEATRVVRVTFKKSAPGGTVAWWTRVYASDAPIDLGTIAERKPAKAAAAQEVWEEAHRIFKDRVREGKVPRLPGAGGIGGAALQAMSSEI